MILAAIVIANTAPAQEDASPAEASAMRVVRGPHIVLKSDGGTAESLRELVQAFEAAVPQWQRFFQIPDDVLNRWQVDAFVINAPERFRQTGDLPEGLNFPFGYATDGNLWVMRQSSDYYTQHLLLHEGIHALQIHLFGGTGPSWYAEGMAELLGLHSGQGEAVRVNVIPKTRGDVPYWGRFKLMSQRRQAGEIPTLDTVLDYPPDLKSDVESYGWSWAAMLMFTGYDVYRPVTLQAARSGNDRSPAFTEAFKQRLRSVWPIVEARWRLLTGTLDYGFDWARETVDIAISDPLWNGQAIETTIRADRGWQSVGVRFPPGTRLTLSATGRCTINDQPKPWISEPPGVTIHYANDRPLGQLLVCVLPNRTSETGTLKPLEVHPVDQELNLQLSQHCWLMFRINDYLDDLGNNQGGYTIRIRQDGAR